jgi:hypothetical protein
MPDVGVGGEVVFHFDEADGLAFAGEVDGDFAAGEAAAEDDDGGADGVFAEVVVVDGYDVVAAQAGDGGRIGSEPTAIMRASGFSCSAYSLVTGVLRGCRRRRRRPAWRG